MAIGTLNASGAVVNTGVAHDTQEDPGGTQYFACALMQGERQIALSETLRFEGDHAAIRKQAARYALECLLDCYAPLLGKLDHEK